MIKEANEKENIFRRAFLEAANEEIEEILQKHPQKPSFSKRHLRTMEKLFPENRRNCIQQQKNGFKNV